MLPTLNSYLSLFPSASREHPRFMALAEAILRQAADLITLAADLQPGFSLARAEGVQLDALADAMGLSRRDIPGQPDPGETEDEAFRRFILSKLALWRWDGTNETAQAVLDALPGSTLTDNQDGTVTVSPADAASLLPVPAGIRPVRE